jgi:precorrin-6Y C5,15-methyltransferase (decarboxylating)
MTVTLIGCGCGSPTEEARAAMNRAELLIGSGRMLRAYGSDKATAEAVAPEQIAALISAADCRELCVLFGGDSGFYTGARRLLPLLKDCDVRLIPGVSSVQLFAARLQRPWQDWLLVSAHGTDCDVLHTVCQGKPAFFLTGGRLGPAELCRELMEAGLGFLEIHIGEELGTERETITSGSADSLAAGSYSPLSVVLAEPAPRNPRRAPGIPDGEKERVFEMFYSGSGNGPENRRSVGMGLSLCRAIVQAHGGEILLRDNIPSGAAFTFTLPLSEVDVHE